jgi:glycosyltransferase involved in cell wall biosynthesis
VRFYQYLPFLQAHGISVTVAPLFPDSYVCDLYAGKGRKLFTVLPAYLSRLRALRSAAEYDLVWIEKELFPWAPAWGERWLHKRRIPFVVDYDDAIFHNYDRNRNSLVRRLLGKKIDEVMERSAIVVVGNAYLAERATLAGAARVEVMPTVVDLDRYMAASRKPTRPFTIGWIGTPVTARYLFEVEQVIAQVCQSDAARLVTVGSGNTTLNGVPHEKRAWSEQTEVADVQSFDCGIMTLPDADWERGKCGYKLIQYMACGLPVVASPVGVNSEIIEEGVNGFLAADQDAWRAALVSLRDDHALCKRMGVAARDTVVQRYCLQVTAPRLLALLGSSVNARK